jgi:putative ABC transport system permease protein
MHSLRWLMRRRAYTLSVMAAMTSGLALLTIVVSAYSAFMLKPLGVDDAESLVRVRELKPGGGTGIESTLSVSPAAFHLWQQHELPFTGMALSTGRELSLTSGDQPERLDAAAVSSNLFEVLGVRPALGRTFAEAEGVAGRDEVVVLNHTLWSRLFDSDPDIIGDTVALDGVLRTVIGVMPAGFAYPNDAQVWIPEVLGDTVNEPGHWSYNVIARLPPGVPIEQATARMSEIAAIATADRPDLSHAPGVHLRKFRAELLDGMDRLLLILLAGAGFVVLISTFNAANITVARAVSERREDAVRLAMGARYRWLYRDALLRALLIMGISAGLAIYFARFAALPFSGLRGLSALDQFPTEVRVDAIAVLTTVTTALAAAVMIAVGSVWLQRSGDLRAALAGGSKGLLGAGRSRMMSTMAVVQVAMTLVLLLGAAMVGGTYHHLMNRERGFDDRNLLLVNVSFAAERYPDAASKERFLDAALARLEAIPGVLRATSATTTPALAGSWGAVFVVEGQPPPEPRGYHITSHRFISDNYFAVMGVPLLDGRPFDSRDHRDGIHSVMVSREFAERFWPGERAVGKRVKRGDADADRPWMTIVGVVEDVVEAGESTLWDKQLQWYLPTNLGAASDFADTFLLIRTGGAVPGVNQAVRQAIWSVDPLLGIEEVAPMRSAMAETFEREQYTSMLFGMFGAVSFVIATVGLYGFLAFRTAMRDSEFGIRMALGARPRQVRLGVLMESAKLFAFSLLISLPVGYLLIRGVKSSLYGVESAGMIELLGIGMLLLATCLSASLIPASRAARAEPMDVLRSE